MNKQLLLSAAWLLIICVAQAENVFSPNPANRNDIGTGPFLVTGSPSIRIQEVHAASDFAGSLGPVYVLNEISYSAPSWSGRVPIDVTLPNIEIRMSTTPKTPDGLSANFFDNVGLDQTVVYAGPLHFFETEEETYDIHIPIAPFRYDPSLGNLLIDVFNYAPIPSRDSGWLIDVASSFGDSVSLVSSGSRGASSPSGFTGTAGLMTRVTYTPVPEPNTWALWGAAGFGLAIAHWARRVRRKD
ncbi:MAG TPA: hypothetical protein VJ063_18015 [Verrucomicrobiae bacterium]|nr:hypothetical protein [Verrucomicrobiae bacterium]